MIDWLNGKNYLKKDKKELIEFSALMVGARRCGKSSALYAMVQEFSKHIRNGELNGISIEADEDTKDIFKTRFGENPPEKIFEEKGRNGRWIVDENADNAANPYRFFIKVKGSKNDYAVTFRDIPGEQFASESPEVEKHLIELFEESQILIICIDTPHLIESGKAYQIFNFPSRINSLLSGMSEKNKEGKDQKRLILFAPMKCEKYYHRALTGIDEVLGNTDPHDMQYVNEVIQETYKNIFIKARSNQQYTVAITPLLTLGGVIFDDFERNEKGKVKKFKTTDTSVPLALRGRPENAFYKFYTTDAEYSPKYCEQPLLYILNYMFAIGKDLERQISQKGSKQNYFDKFVDYVKTGEILKDVFVWGLFGIPGLVIKNVIQMNRDKKFVDVISFVSKKHMKLSGDGYELVCDPLGIGAYLKS